MELPAVLILDIAWMATTSLNHVRQGNILTKKSVSDYLRIFPRLKNNILSWLPSNGQLTLRCKMHQPLPSPSHVPPSSKWSLATLLGRQC